MSKAVRDRVQEQVPCRQVDKIAVKGKSEGVCVYTARSSLTTQEQKAWPIHEDAVAKYYAREFPAAIEGFREVLSILADDYPASLYLERAQNFLRRPPPPEWDGVEVLTEK
jgi:adenylate cyclase